MEKIKISVIIPTYNRAALLKEAIQSVINQTYDNILEIIITDDNSTDNTVQVVQDFIKKDKRIKYLKNSATKKGVTGNKNNGIKAARGDFIFMLDDDDILFPDGIKILVDTYMEHPECNIIIANRERTDTGGYAGYGLKKDGYVTYKDVLCEKLKGNFVGIIKREILQGRQLDISLAGCGESVLWKELYKYNLVYYVHRKIMLYRIGHTSVISQRDKKPEEAIKIYRALINKYEEDYLRYCPKILAKLYANIGYFQIIAQELESAKQSLFVSLKIRVNFRALALLLLLIFPPKVLIKLKNFVFKILKKY